MCFFVNYPGYIFSRLGVDMVAHKKSSLAGVSILQLLETDFFSKFSEEQKFAISNKDIFYLVKNGEYLLRKGESQRSIFVLMKGVVNAIDDKGRVINTQITGSIIGEISFLTNLPCTCSVVAKGDVFVMELDEEVMEKLDDSLTLLIKDILIQVLVERVTDMDRLKAKANIKRKNREKKKEKKKTKSKGNKKG
jgi:CRP-like cAMP-binding protein